VSSSRFPCLRAKKAIQAAISIWPLRNTNIPRKYLKWFFSEKNRCKVHVFIILQMFVFGEVQEPIPETVNLVEDIVRSQLIELVRLDVAD